MSASGKTFLPNLGRSGGGPAARMPEMMGRQKAAVLPEPVCAHAMRSRFASEMGMAWRCTGVGFEYLHWRMFSITPG